MMMITIIILKLGFGAFLSEEDGLENCVCVFIDRSTIDMGNISFVLFIAFIETFLSKALLICDGMGFLGGHILG